MLNFILGLTIGSTVTTFIMALLMVSGRDEK